MSVFGDFKINGSTLVAKETGAQIPLTTSFLREAVSAASFVWLINAVRAARSVRRAEARAKISFFPKKPRSYYAIWPVCQLANVRIVDDPRDADLHFYFEDREFLTAQPLAPSGKPVFNIGCYDIRKSVVARIFEEVFGYSLAIDPLSHIGPAVAKSEHNGRHDGRIISCPLTERAPGMVYQRLVDNTFDGREHVDIRTPIVGGEIPFVYLKRRSPDLRFSNDNLRVDMAETDVMLSEDEQAKIIRFAREIGLDFGGIDVLRDRTDGRIYIVDANKTDMGPPTALTSQNKLRAMRGLAASFAKLVDDTLSDA